MFESMVVNQGFLPESLLFWRRWRKPEPSAEALLTLDRTEDVEPTGETDGGEEPAELPLVFESMVVNQGFLPESLLFWRRWRKPEPSS